ncbi:MAG: hypothetical protein K9G47_03640 [Bacteroidales bacterium]|nr:hypothetical protein [Bacteroidales bacterium]
MKKAIGIFMIMLAMVFAGMQSANAQWTITVHWDDQCGGCPTPGGYEYYVCLQVKDTCRGVTVFSQDCVIVSSGNNQHTFNVGQICSVDEHRNCMQMAYGVVKRCINGQSTICSASNITYTRCELIYLGEDVSVDLE